MGSSGVGTSVGVSVGAGVDVATSMATDAEAGVDVAPASTAGGTSLAVGDDGSRSSN